MVIPYKAPTFLEKAFNCPHCGAYSNQGWVDPHMHDGRYWNNIPTIDLAFCVHCNEYSLWHEGRMIHPASGSAPLPNPDLPEEVKSDYAEARSIVALSPRGATALLRLAIQKLCKVLGEKGNDLNADIGNLVKKGLPEKIQKALDVVRVIGNNAVHPGQIDLKDDSGTAEKLFGLVNLIADVMITQPKQVDILYSGLPDSQKAAITDKTPNASPLGVRMKAWYPGPHGVPADQPCGLRVEVPSRLGPEVPEGGAQRAGGPAVEDGVPRDRRTLRVHGGGARSDAGSRPRVRLGTPALESRRAGQGAEERLGETALRRVPPAPRADVGWGTLERWLLCPGHRRCGDRGHHPAIYPLPASA